MRPGKLKVIHYLNQFFGQEGLEDKADMRFMVKKGPVGPGIALQNILGEKADVTVTLICGDNYFAENTEEAAEEGLRRATPYSPDIFFAGPAFGSGRYGIACGAMCKILQERLGIPSITGMSEENPGLDLFRRDVYICRTRKSALKMAEDLAHMVNIALKLTFKSEDSRLMSGIPIGSPKEDGYFPRGILINRYIKQAAAARAVDMLMTKIKGLPFQTEAECRRLETRQSPPLLGKELSTCEIALISDGGLVPKDNPDRLRSSGNMSWAAYKIDALWPDQYTATDYEISHTGYYPVHILNNPNRLVPVDILRDLEKEGIIKKLHPVFYSTSGNGAAQASCRKMGEEIAGQLNQKDVDGVIQTST